MDFDIKKARFDDVEDLCAVQAAAIEAFGPSDYSENEINAWVGNIDIPHVLETMQNEDAEIFVARCTDNFLVLGFCAIKEDQITDIYVDPEYANQGIGSVLLRKAEWHIRKNGNKSVRLLSTINSIGFYEENGYDALNTFEFEVNDNTSLKLMEMKKNLRMSA